MHLSRRAIGFGLLTLPLAGCGSKVPTGLWLNINDTDDRIEVLSKSTARITALFGQPIDRWHPTGAQQSEAGRVIAEAQRQLAQYETVDVEYEYVEANDTLTFRAAERGSRPMFYARSDMMFDRLVNDRTFLLQKS